MFDTSVAAISDRIDRHDVSPVELTDAAIAAANDRGKAALAFTRIFDERAHKMAQASEARTMAGARLGPLDGVPVTVKDILALVGTTTSNGAGPGWETDGLASSPTVASLERNGAVIVGKTNLHELGMGISNDNPHFGATQNPWHAGYSPGGSSGGSAAALVLGIGYGSIGTDTGGSIRIPASACGIFGLKPTIGRFSTDRVSGIAWSLDHVGPLARSAADLALIYESMATSNYARPGPVRDDLRGLRIGIPTNYFNKRIEGGVARATAAAYSALEELGAVLVDIAVPAFDDAVSAAFILAMVEAAYTHRQRLQAHEGALGGDVAQFLRSGHSIPASDYVGALKARDHFRIDTAALFDRIDILAAPTVPATPKPFTDEEVVIDGETEPMFNCMIRLTCPFNITGNPVLSAPCPTLADGLPCGIQLIGPYDGEALLLRIGALYEATALDAHHQRLAALNT